MTRKIATAAAITAGTIAAFYAAIALFAYAAMTAGGHP